MILDTLLGFRIQGKTMIMRTLSGGWGPNIVGPDKQSRKVIHIVEFCGCFQGEK